jgi:hypothetical protein
MRKRITVRADSGSLYHRWADVHVDPAHRSSSWPAPMMPARWEAVSVHGNDRRVYHMHDPVHGCDLGYDIARAPRDGDEWLLHRTMRLDEDD